MQYHTLAHLLLLKQFNKPVTINIFIYIINSKNQPIATPNPVIIKKSLPS